MRLPIIQSLLDTDLYKLTQAQVVFHDFHDAHVEYEFINRNQTPFPKGFDTELKAHILNLSLTRMSADEYSYLGTLDLFRPTWLEWFKNYSFRPDEVEIKQNEVGQLSIKIRGPWYRVIFWEVPLMAIISELYFKMTGQRRCFNWTEIIVDKAKLMSDEGVKWIDFGTRRRFSLEVQDMVVCIMKNYNGFVGTSNPMLAMKYNVPVKGTMAHEFVMGMQAKCSPQLSNRMAMNHWYAFYKGKLDIVLPDTLTTDFFLKGNDSVAPFGLYDMSRFSGIRQDSGDPEEWMDNKVIPHYTMWNSKPQTVVFSDSLDPQKAIHLSKKYGNYTNVICGIGTNLSNDVGCQALNMVIKLTKVQFKGMPMIDVVKLSDAKGKYTGNSDKVIEIKKKLGIE